MPETLKCPYCGAETRLNENNEGVYWYECWECNATGPTEKTREDALSAALHRTEPEMRPMTLEEIQAKANEEDWNFVWLENKESRLPLQLCPWNRERNKIIFCGLPFDVQIEADIAEIRKSWRCWPRKPTPEQMAAEKWEE